MTSENFVKFYFLLIQVILIALKVSGSLDWEWFWVFFPTILLFLLGFFIVISAAIMANRQKEINKSNRK